MVDERELVQQFQQLTQRLANLPESTKQALVPQLHDIAAALKTEEQRDAEDQVRAAKATEFKAKYAGNEDFRANEVARVAQYISRRYKEDAKYREKRKALQREAYARKKAARLASADTSPAE
ncbi:hypothetical protein WJX72_012040 [[Myrmecia] bisecta]|uniref:Uncharacterized protein n=1 Tax=[Myrmecia] bisecta TaxID=41462 RepID=A0AAW1PFJ6_9CHLO